MANEKRNENKRGMTDTEILDHLERHVSAEYQHKIRTKLGLLSRLSHRGNWENDPSLVEFSTGSDPYWYPSLREALIARFTRYDTDLLSAAEIDKS